MKLIDFKKNIYSQFGEDGIIEKIFSIIGTASKLCVEFGAWDGEYLSNTANLWKHNDWKAILIEAEAERIKNLNHQNVIAINSTVGFDNNKDSIDFILKSNNINEIIDFMSVDIDGNDYYILENLQCRPRLLCIEYNPTIPFWIDCYQQKDGNFGASLAAINRLANKIDYHLISTTDTNAFFVSEENIKLFSGFNINYADIACRNHYISIITDYGGNQKIIGTPPYGMKGIISEDKIIL